MSRRTRRVGGVLRQFAVGTAIIAFVAVGGFAVWRGVVGTPEPTLRYPDVTAAILARVDADQSGYVEAEEYGRVGLEDVAIDRFDIDADGRLSPYEVEISFLTESPSLLVGEHANQLQGPGPGGRGGGQGAAGTMGGLPPPPR